MFDSWMLETIMPNTKQEVLDPREVKVTFTPSAIKIYSETNNLLENINPGSMVWNCAEKEDLCSPVEMLQFYK
jgi:hypothetical protein